MRPGEGPEAAANRRPTSRAGRAAVAGVPGARGATSVGAAEHEQESAGASIQEVPAGREQDVTASNIPAASTACDGPPPPPLPIDLQLEIVARSEDPAAVVRCAAASKPLRRAILGQGFRRRLALRAAANDGFDPALLVAVSYRLRDLDTDRVVVQPSGRLRFDTSLLQSFQPASSRDGLLVLCRDRVLYMDMHINKNVELLVCNAFTGHVTSLPRIHLGIGRGTSGIFWPALLTVDSASSTFEMLVMEQVNQSYKVRTQTFLSEEGKWGHVRIVHVPPVHDHIRIGSTDTAPVVIGRTIHWLCESTPEFRNYVVIILALQADAAQATVIELPRVSFESMGSCKDMPVDGHGLILAATAEGTRLSLVVAETLVISMWTLLPIEGSSRWSRQVVICRQEIDRQLTAGLEGYPMIRFCGFGERSGTVLFWMVRVGLVQLNLGTKKALVLRRYSDSDRMDLASLHEINLVSLLQGMKPF